MLEGFGVWAFLFAFHSGLCYIEAWIAVIKAPIFRGFRRVVIRVFAVGIRACGWGFRDLGLRPEGIEFGVLGLWIRA